MIPARSRSGRAAEGESAAAEDNDDLDGEAAWQARTAQQAKQVTPEAATVDDTLGWTYYRKGMYPLAVTHLESVIAREPNARRQYHLAMAYLKSGDAKRGRQALDAAVKADPRLPEAQVAKEMFAATPR